MLAANYELYYIALPKIRSALLKNRELHPAVFSDFSSLADDYLHSQQYGVGSVGGKEHAPAILAAFGQACAESGVTAPEQLTIVSLENALVGRLSRLDLPLPVRRGIPEMLRGFFGYLACSGSFPPAAEWAGWLSLIDKKYQARFRDDGTVRGETFKKKYSDVDRNDPCPCGSGKKFKKCCMNLIG